MIFENIIYHLLVSVQVCWTFYGYYYIMAQMNARPLESGEAGHGIRNNCDWSHIENFLMKFINKFPEMTLLR